ncbi:ImmA/IrrE family metallo-endopeptidase [Sphingomonas sp.]|uniref:ImmA/IrrE family metallo-endopeptidase n=1 Tax=Sphingomonas sp. TaxID=28214 RepID=UPI0025F7896F|nr:ImmA/IrrE family metallo-endopeptidase [Sphingomonas sp.]
MLDAKEQNRRRRIEAEANRFAAALLMPVPRLRSVLASRRPSLTEIVRLADEFDVSKEAMARSYVEAHREAVAVILCRLGRIVRIYRNERHFPWIVPSVGGPIPPGSIGHSFGLEPGKFSEIEECDADTWLSECDVRRVEILTEQLLAQRGGFAMLLLHAEVSDKDEDGDERGALYALP